MSRNSSTRADAWFFGVLVTMTCITLVSSGGGGEGSDEENDPNDISHGLGNHIAWRPLKEGFELAKENEKPLMLIMHKSWCGACKALKPKLKASKEMEDLSQKFIMVNTEDNDEPPEDIYRPDGGYIPRILFFSPEGELLKEVINDGGNPKFQYYYYDAESVIESMNRVVKLFQKSEDSDKSEEEKQNSNREEKSEL